MRTLKNIFSCLFPYLLLGEILCLVLTAIYSDHMYFVFQLLFDFLSLEETYNSWGWAFDVAIGVVGLAPIVVTFFILNLYRPHFSKDDFKPKTIYKTEYQVKQDSWESNKINVSSREVSEKDYSEVFGNVFGFVFYIVFGIPLFFSLILVMHAIFGIVFFVALQITKKDLYDELKDMKNY